VKSFTLRVARFVTPAARSVRASRASMIRRRANTGAAACRHTSFCNQPDRHARNLHGETYSQARARQALLQVSRTDAIIHEECVVRRKTRWEAMNELEKTNNSRSQHLGGETDHQRDKAFRRVHYRPVGPGMVRGRNPQELPGIGEQTHSGMPGIRE